MIGKSPQAGALLSLLALAATACAPGARSGPEASAALRAFAAADSLHSQPLGPGVLYIRAWERAGPWAIHVVEVDTARCAPRWSARKPAGSLDGRARTSTLAGDALAAVNADFFQLPGGTPVGPQVTGGRVLIGPGDRPAWLWGGRVFTAGATRLDGSVSAAGDSLPLVQVNRAAASTTSYHPPPRGATLFTSLAPAVPPADSAADVVFIAVTAGDERAGTGQVLRVLRAQTDTVRLPAGMAAIQLWGEARAWAARRTAGDPLQWHTRLLPGSGDWPTLEAVGGFPLLLHDDKDVLAGTTVTPSFAQRHPRTAIGWSSRSGRVFLVAVDGRQSPYSDGMTLTELLDLFRRLGATEALNLDGGGSTTIVSRGVVLNRPSDREGERAVGNALLLAGCDARPTGSNR